MCYFLLYFAQIAEMQKTVIMKTSSADYDLFFKFIETYTPLGYQGIDRNDPLIFDLEKLTKEHNQFFFVGDLIESRIIWASSRSHEMIGIKPENLTAYHFMEATHPEDYNKHSLGRVKMYSLANDFFAAEKGESMGVITT